MKVETRSKALKARRKAALGAQGPRSPHDPAQSANLMERFASKCAYEINKLQGWEGSVFSSRYRGLVPMVFWGRRRPGAGRRRTAALPEALILMSGWCGPRVGTDTHDSEHPGSAARTLSQDRTVAV